MRILFRLRGRVVWEVTEPAFLPRRDDKVLIPVEGADEDVRVVMRVTSVEIDYTATDIYADVIEWVP